MPQAELKDLVGTIDTDENGNIEYQEFLTLMARKLKELESPDTLINAFKVCLPSSPAPLLSRNDTLVQVFDKEDSGYISVAEFRHLMTSVYIRIRHHGFRLYELPYCLPSLNRPWR